MQQSVHWLENDFAYTNKVLQYSKSQKVILQLTSDFTGNAELGPGMRAFFDPSAIPFGTRINAIEVSGEFAPSAPFLMATFVSKDGRAAVSNIPLADLCTQLNNGRIKVFDFDIDLQKSYVVNITTVAIGVGATVPFNFHYN